MGSEICVNVFTHIKAVLNNDLVRKLREEYKDGDSWMELEKKYSISRGALRSAILRKTWNHVK